MKRSYDLGRAQRRMNRRRWMVRAVAVSTVLGTALCTTQAQTTAPANASASDEEARPATERLDSARLDKASGWWFPAQKAPRGLVHTTPAERFAVESTAPGTPGARRGPSLFTREHVMVQSVAGLAARAVNEGRGDELVWVTHNNADQLLWLKLVTQRLKLEDRGTLGPWELVKRFADKGVIDGYILYHYSSRGESNQSVNVATSLAGPMRAILVDETQEARAKELGLRQLADARTISPQELMDRFGDKFSRKMLFLQSPRIPHARDFAIAHSSATLFGSGEPIPSAFSRLESGSPIMGWNHGDEGANTDAISTYGLFNTATDWCMNLPVLAAGAAEAKTEQLPAFDAKRVDWDRAGKNVAFVMSDGDNLQWATTTFFKEPTKAFWGSVDHGKSPFTWTMCLAHLRQVAPDALQYLIKTLPKNAEVVEFGGGYYNPDTFAINRPDRAQALTEHARATWANMKATGADVLCLIAKDLASPASMEAYEIYAREMPGLTGIIVMNYYPYHGGKGEVLWVKRPDGVEIPIVSARLELRTDYSLEGIGDSPDIAKKIVTPMFGQQDVPANQWVVVHAWSDFEPDGTKPGANRGGNDPDAKKGMDRGVGPTQRTIERLPKDVHAIGIREMLWRIRMDRDPVKTRELLGLPAKR